jgi:1,4-alpha-glucan branching enzyme
MYANFGAAVAGNIVTLRLFFPDAGIDPTQYRRGSDPRILTIRVGGTFQSRLGAMDWDLTAAPSMTKCPHPNGWVYVAELPALPAGFYEYKYYVQFQNGTARWCGDPCTKYGGAQNQNAAFVVGGRSGVTAELQRRLPLADQILYELMIDDFTAGYRGDRAPIEALADKIGHLKALGVTSVAFMPWTAWPNDAFGWGYNPTLFFSVEHRYVNDPAAPLEKLNKLKVLINTLHQQGLHVIMDGVFSHVDTTNAERGFPYYWLYEDPNDSPFIGTFVSAAFGTPLDFANACTSEFIYDVCSYWLEQFSVDGIRFDYALGFYNGNPNQGIIRLVRDLQARCVALGRSNIAFILEMLTDNRFEAIHDTDTIGASGCWFDPLMYQSFEVAENRPGSVSPFYLRCLNAGKDFDRDKVPVTYLENHDNFSITSHAGGRSRWFKAQPIVIALMTCCGAPMVHNGQELAQDLAAQGTEIPRPLDWALSTDPIGTMLRDGLHGALARIRSRHRALRSHNFYPESYSESLNTFNSEGYGIDEARRLAIYHRWGDDDDGNLERFIIAINFGDDEQNVDLPFSANGAWTDLLSGTSVTVANYMLPHQKVSSNWGLVYCKVESFDEEASASRKPADGAANA